MKVVAIKFMNGAKYTLRIHEDSFSVLSLKELIEERLNIKKETQRLIYNGSPLENSQILNNLPDNCIIHIVLQLATIDE